MESRYSDSFSRTELGQIQNTKCKQPHSTSKRSRKWKTAKNTKRCSYEISNTKQLNRTLFMKYKKCTTCQNFISFLHGHPINDKRGNELKSETNSLIRLYSIPFKKINICATFRFVWPLCWPSIKLSFSSLCRWIILESFTIQFL